MDRRDAMTVTTGAALCAAGRTPSRDSLGPVTHTKQIETPEGEIVERRTME